MKFAAVFATASLALILPVSADVIAVANSGFESPSMSDGAYMKDPTLAQQGGAGWVFSGRTGIQDSEGTEFAGTSQQISLPGTANGYNFAYLNPNADTNGAASYFYQTVGLLQPDTTYTLTVAVGNRLDYATVAGVKVSFLNGTSQTGSVLFSGIDAAPSQKGTFVDDVLTFTTGDSASGSLTLLFQDASTTASAAIDNVRLTATSNKISSLTPSATPEPSTWALLTVGALGAALGLRRRFRAA